MFWIFCTFIFGTIIGSFLGVVADRLPTQRSLLTPRSHCTACQYPLRAHELIPIFSILCQRFRCNYCQAKLSADLLIIELVCGLLFSYYLSLPLEPIKVWYLIWLLTTLVLAVIDSNHLIVDLRIMAFSALLLISGALLLHRPLYLHHVPIVLLGYWLLQKAHPKSLGLGDLWLFSLWSLFLSWYQLSLLLVVASGSGILWFLAAYQQQKALTRLPFVPFLFVGLLLVLLLNLTNFV